MNPMIIGGLLSLGGTLINVMGQRQAASDARSQAEAEAANAMRAARYGAAQSIMVAKGARATSQREASEYRRTARLTASRALAVAAASGGGASDPTVTKIISDITSEGAYRAALALYEGEEEARLRETQATSLLETGRATADARRYEGESIARASQTRMFGTLMESGASWADKYGKVFFPG